MENKQQKNETFDERTEILTRGSLARQQSIETKLSVLTEDYQ